MNKLVSLVCFFLLGTCLVAQKDAQIEELIEKQLAEMTLDEKIGQTALRGTSSRVKGTLPDELKSAVRAGEIGAFLNVMNPDYVEELQRIAVEESPQGIPLIFSRDVIHGFKTIFPIPLGIAASWDPEVAEYAARVSAIEASEVGVRWTFAPMLDISRDSRWGRIAESPGEDPYLGALMAEAYVKGFQGDDLADSKSMVACAKHMIGYGAAIGGRDYNTAVLAEPLLRNVYLPPFKAAIDAGALTVMSSFNEVNGVPATGNAFLLKQLLRDELGFNGFVVSDWNSVTEMIPHGYAVDEKHAAELAGNAGMDMEMTSKAYEHHLKDLIKEGKVSEEQLDFYVRNILRVKHALNLYEDPYYLEERRKEETWYATEHLELAKAAAIKSSVLLENKGVLPLSGKEQIALIGPLADAPREQLGTWTFDGDAAHTFTVRNAMESAWGDDKVNFVEGLAYSRDRSRDGFKRAIEAARTADVIVFVGGEEAILSGEAHSRADIRLPGAQEELLKELAETGKPIVLVMMAGRPIEVMNILSDVDAMLMAWHPGTMGGEAVSDILLGVAEAGGRLPVTWPKTAGQLPLFYNHKNTGRPADSTSFVHIDDIPVGAWQSSLGNNSHYLDVGFTPHFPFGYGLSYTQFEYSDLKLSSIEVNKGESITISALITNTGTRAGEEVAQLYVQDVVGSITRPIRELKGIQRIYLAEGEQKRVNFTISSDDLKFVNTKMEYRAESGQFNVWIGAHALHGLKGSFLLKE